MTVSVDALAAALQPIISRVRTDVTAVRIADGTSRWTNEPLTNLRLRQHLSGGPGRGVCPIKEGESTTRLALLDLDSHHGETPWSGMVEVATKLIDALRDAGLMCTPFRSSGGRGIHLFMLWAEPQDAYSVRSLISEVLASVGYRHGAGGVKDGQVEIFPKQDRVGAGEYGNQFILPLAGKSEPLDDLFNLAPMGRDGVNSLSWPLSVPVAVRQPPRRIESAALSSPVEIHRVVSALATIPNPNKGEPGEIDYDTWRDLAFAVHEATGGSEEGFAAFADWSARSDKHDGPFLQKRVWHYIRPADTRNGGGVTRSTLFATAVGHGWTDTTSADGMPEVEPDFSLVTVPIRRQQKDPSESANPSADTTDLWADASPAGDDLGLSEYQDEPQAAGSELQHVPVFDRDSKGKILSIVTNLTAAVRRPEIAGCHIRLDEFREEIMISEGDDKHWRAFNDADYVWLRHRLESGRNGFAPIGKELIRDVVVALAERNRFDTAITWLNGLKHDGKPRCETFLIDYFGAEDTPYTRAVSLYLWTALAGRVLSPGCKADMVPILVGKQGLRKSTAVKALVPSPDYFFECSFTEKEEDLSRKMRGKLVAEIGELRGLQTKELEGIKAFIARTHEQWIPKYREFTTTFPRRLLFIGTTNKNQFLADETGNRRWLPVKVFKRVDTDRLQLEVPLLWAEAAGLYQETGIRWQDAERLAEDVHEEFSFRDAWEEKVKAWFYDSDDLFGGPELANLREHATSAEALVGALGYEPRSITRREEMRIASVFTKLGFVQRRISVNGEQKWRWLPSLPT